MNRLRQFFCYVCLVYGSLMASAWAEESAPIVDLSQSPNTESGQYPISQSITHPVQESLSLDQRVTRLEQQINNLTEMDLPGKLDNLQEEMQKLSGKLEVQSHDIKTLNDQLRDFYNDLDQRVSRINSLNTSNTGLDSSNNASVNMPNSLTAKEQQAYQKAFDALRNKNYDNAAEAMQSYLTDYPNGSYATNAYYWLGQIYYMQQQYDKAQASFETLINKYPTSQKIPDTKLKLALISDATGKHDEAKKALEALKKQYPGTTAAQLADAKLKEIQSTTNTAASGVKAAP